MRDEKNGMKIGNLSFYENQALFGHDSTPRLVAFEVEGEDQVRIFRRDDGGNISSELRSFNPFVLLADKDLLGGWRGESRIDALEGSGFLRYVAVFPGLRDLFKAKDHLQKASGRTPNALDSPYLFLNDPVHQYLLMSGQTHFLELPFDGLHRLQLDIETYCQEGFEFSNPQREADCIIAIALSDSKGWERLLSGKELSEAEMLQELVREIRGRDPDVIEGHNIFRFDLEYIEARAQRHGIPLGLGRDGSILKGHPSRMQIAERTIAYRKYEVFGRHIVDTWMLAQYYDITARNLESYGLKGIARHFGLASPERTYVEPDRIGWYYDHEPEVLFRYALDDVRETRAIGDLLSRGYFVQAQIFPYSYQNVILRGNATKIDALFLREYLHRGHSIPVPSRGQEVAGGHTEICYQGVVQNVFHCDITSLYPSIMLSYGCFPRSDELGVFPKLLQDLKDFRVQAKELARRASQTREAQPSYAEDDTSYLEALQATFKILINSFYGYLGFTLGHFNDFERANQVTATGRELIREMMTWLEEQGCRLIEVDTDGIYFVPPEGFGNTETVSLLEELSRTLPEGIHLELDGQYQAMFSYKMKNYALLDPGGKIVVKGSGLKSRGLEPFQRIWMEEMFGLLLRGDRKGIHEMTERTLDDIAHHRMDIKKLGKTETLQDSLETYREKIKGKKRNPSASYELALKSGRSYQPGDQISYYVAGDDKKVKVHEACKPASLWDPRQPDENVAYYQDKLRSLFKKFQPFFSERC